MQGSASSRLPKLFPHAIKSVVGADGAVFANGVHLILPHYCGLFLGDGVFVRQLSCLGPFATVILRQKTAAKGRQN
jgi:hypothetical protein